jgi:hypothetical protein
MKNMRDRNKTRKSSLTGFIRYTGDKMNSEERNAFERELQKDPFAEEAAEGLSGISPKTAEDDIAELKKRMRGRTGKGGYYLFYRIAAAAAVVLIISSIFIVTRNEKQPVTISQNLSQEPKAPAPVNAPENNGISSPAQSRKKQVISSPEPAKRAIQKEEKKIDENKFAELREPEINESAVSDQDIAIAYDSLASERALPSVKMTGVARAAGAASKEKSEASRDYQPPKPVGGIDLFNLFIENNMHNPEPGKSKEQTVSLSFIVYRDSTISDIRIIRSPGDNYSREAIRLIKKGPVWEPALENGKIAEDSIRINIVFK